MRHHRAVVGGEGNGGVLYPPANFARDSLVGMGLVLHLLAQTRKTVSALAAPYAGFRVVKLQRHCPADRAREVLKRARRAWADRPLDLLDGVKVRVEEGWFSIRPSNTEPIVRVLAEGPSEGAARELALRVMADLEAWLEEAPAS
jgi:phosphomannomutase